MIFCEYCGKSIVEEGQMIVWSDGNKVHVTGVDCFFWQQKKEYDKIRQDELYAQRVSNPGLLAMRLKNQQRKGDTMGTWVCGGCGASVPDEMQECMVCGTGKGKESAQQEPLKEDKKMGVNAKVASVNSAAKKVNPGLAKMQAAAAAKKAAAAKQKPAPKKAVAAKPAVKKAAPKAGEKFTTITCVDCGKKRTVHVQDAFQVKRCVACQELHKKAKRAANRAKKAKAAKFAPKKKK